MRGHPEGDRQQACLRGCQETDGAIWRVTGHELSRRDARVRAARMDDGLKRNGPKGNTILPVAMRPGDTPVPIPNTMVKAWAADGTALETVWESRWLPDYLKKNRSNSVYIYTDISE